MAQTRQVWDRVYQHRYMLGIGAFLLLLVFMSLRTGCIRPFDESPGLCVDPRYPPTLEDVEDSSSTGDLLDAVVFIMMGKAAHSSFATRVLSNLRRTGQYHGPIYILTDRAEWPCVAGPEYGTVLIPVPLKSSRLDIHIFKTRVFDLLPDEHRRILYLDADIFVTKPLRPFLEHIRRKFDTATGPRYTTGFFQDSAGHLVGYCADCDKYHGGVMYVERGRSEGCLQTWADAIRSEAFEFDQQALDFVAEKPECELLTLPAEHLMFMRDFLATLSLPAKTFSHVTGAFRPEEQTGFYRWVLRQKLSLDLLPFCGA